jgi:membrane protease YdiL (CAAX protease family)
MPIIRSQAPEFAFRGYLLFTLTQATSFWPAAVLTSILFGLIHLDVGAPWPVIVNFCALALFACLAIRRTGTLWFAIGAHVAFDWADSFFYSIGGPAVQGQLFQATVHGSPWLSGGAAGPDGNIFNLVLVAASILLLSRLYPQVKYPPAS